MYFIGIDGGTSYSKLIGVDEDLKTVGRHMGNAVTLTGPRQEFAADNLSRLMGEFSKLTNSKPQDCAGVCIGVSGLDEPDGFADKTHLEEVFTDTLGAIAFDCPVRIVSDAEIVLATQTKGGPGILVSSAIDAFAFAVCEDGERLYQGGLGHTIDGGGGGYVIGMQAVKYALMSYDGRIAHTVLEEKVCEHFAAAGMAEVLLKLRGGSYSPGKIAELALVVKYAAQNGDGLARLIQENAAKELHMLARAIIARCGMEQPAIALNGPVLVLNDAVRTGFISLLNNDYPDIVVETVKEKPEMGAVYLAMGDARICEAK